MSAASRVPPELWIKIIRAATHVPEAFDATTHDALPPRDEPALHSQAVFTSMHESIVTKATISLVCRMWHDICLEFLYECIVVRDAIHLPHLVDLLSRTHPGASKRVRRLDLVYLVPRPMTRRVDGVSYSDRRLVRAASKLVRQCRNLQVFSCRTVGDHMDGVVSKASFRSMAHALIHVAGTLQSIEWCPHWDADASVLLQIIQRCSQLRSLVSPEAPGVSSASSGSGLFCGSALRCAEDLANESSSDGSLDDLPPIASENSLTSAYIHTLTFHHTGVWRPTQHGISDDLLSLRHVIVSSTRLELLQSFLSLHPQVDTLTFRRGAFRSIERVQEDFVASSAVHTLVFYLQELPMTPVSFPHVERVGLKGMETLSPELYDYGFNLFTGGSGMDLFPSLTLIRFIDAPLARNFEKRKLQFKLWHYRCLSKGVRLENERGELMIPERL